MSTHNNQFYFFANWKMYLDFNEANILAHAIASEHKQFSANVKMAIFPNALSLYTAGQTLKDVGIAVGGQNVFWEDKGGYTGEISATMYQAAGCDYALVGHSERRHQFHETNHEVRQKMQAVLESGLTPVLCVGETLKEREDGKTEEVVEIQLRSALQDIVWPTDRELIIAYEPVWAISKGAGANEAGKHCDDVEAERVHKMIREFSAGLIKLDPVVLFGGSVRPPTTDYYLRQLNVNGILVGAASTQLESFMGILSNIK
ncbi:MAG: triose-phosphate isomerase [Candidatus Magasanikbacteria bacterium RIFOXYC2_FULL_42_28]|uniref:Triosephosphate isomerase n=1 Tax=Candidatus Magasanikbacteria bacterium RIFOXYC2_FULL_42_28 TaxID=1798704 RepID=A0A1F6NUM4_9BACT|nr:MAG: triose-phosphate isomerase [Candidatus Magasanikbacteria bacterium RIFOXYC2_FULL_42_28]